MAYTVLHALPGNRSQLARDDSGRLVVLKSLPRDCLYRGQLHAHVHDRLSRVREVPDFDVANLHGVELVEGGGARLIWDYIPGRDLPAAADLDVLSTARSLVLAVERLHLLGLVHGALHMRNVIVTPEGRLVLTHVSPLVIDDPRRDAADLAQLLRNLNSRPGIAPTPELARILSDLGPVPELPELRGRLLLAETAIVSPPAAGASSPGPRSGWVATSLAASAVGVAALLMWAARGTGR
jgi:hypothetical protein